MEALIVSLCWTVPTSGVVSYIFARKNYPYWICALSGFAIGAFGVILTTALMNI